MEVDDSEESKQSSVVFNVKNEPMIVVDDEDDSPSLDLNSNDFADYPSVISWGRSDFGGLMRKNDESGTRDGLSFYQLSGRSVVSIASNVYHTAAVTATGELFTCGQNDQGQVSDEACVDEIEKPRLLESLSNHRIHSVSCGLYHTCVVTASGCAISFGGNENGQLGHSIQKHAKVGPRVVNFILPPRKVPLVISQVACGDFYSLFLTTTGEVYGCGSAAFLGNPIRSSQLIISQAERIEALVGSNIMRIAAGSSHSHAVSTAGEVYAWGSNKHNELGIESIPTRDGEFHEQIPKSVTFPQDAGQVLGISSGYSHTVLWTSHGLLYGTGNNKYGQLAIMTPRVTSFSHIELPTACIMAVCGSNHTLVLCNDQRPLSSVGAAVVNSTIHTGSSLVRVPSITASASTKSSMQDKSTSLNRTKLYGFGANMMCQVKSASDASTMCRAPTDLSLELAHAWEVSEILYIGAGGDHSFAIATTSSSRALAGEDSKKSPPRKGNMLQKQFSTLISKAVIPMSTTQLQNLVEKAQLAPDIHLQTCLSTIAEIFSSPSLLSASFGVAGKSRDCIDAEGLEHLYVSILRLHSSALPRLLGAIQQTLTELESALHATKRLSDTSSRVFAILWQAPLMGEAVLSADLFFRLARLVYHHRSSFGKYLLDRASSQYPMHIFVTRFVKSTLTHLQSQVTSHGDAFTSRYQQSQRTMSRNQSEDHRAPELDTTSLYCKLLHVLYMSTSLPQSSTISSAEWVFHRHLQQYLTYQNHTDAITVPVEAFQSTALSSLSDAALVMDVVHWRKATKQTETSSASAAMATDAASATAGLRQDSSAALRNIFDDEDEETHISSVTSAYFYISNYPYLLTVEAKRKLILAEAALQQQAAQRHAVAQGILLNGGMVMPYFIIPVERNHLLQQTVIYLENASSLDIKKPLKIMFIGEEGIDEGGVKKEFFQLLIAQLFEAQYGLFEPTVTGRHLWVNSSNVWSESEYKLVGSVLALAVYNNVVLDCHLPLIFYKKLLQRLPTTLEDLQVLDPELYKGFKLLLDFPHPEQVEDVFCRTFSVEYKAFDTTVVHDLIPDGRNIPVTGANRKEFVDKYVHWLLDESVESQFQALRSGFSRVIAPEQLVLLTPVELELLIAGVPYLDFRELEISTEYIGDSNWNAENNTIVWFWQIVHGLPLDDKQRLLKFITGAHKAPIGGLKALGLKIQRAGPDANSLPTAHTCFNTLLLPEYASAEKLQDRLLKAIHECEGFGLK